MEYRLRPASEPDKGFLFHLHVQTMHAHIDRTWGWDEAWQRNDFEQRFDRCAVSVIEVAGESIGALWLEARPEGTYITDLQVLPAWQRRGIGSAVLRQVMTDASQRELNVELAVLTTNTGARRLYERLGFRESGHVEPFVYMQYSSKLDIRRCDLGSTTAAALIGALNAELVGQYPEPGANHFRLDPDEVGEGRGAFLVAYAGDTPIGCGAIRRIDADTAEIKRMYVDPAVRGRGVGHRVLTALEAEARRLGATRLVLETGERAHEAMKLYARAGFVRIPCFGEYADSPLSVCMAKNL